MCLLLAHGESPSQFSGKLLLLCELFLSVLSVDHVVLQNERVPKACHQHPLLIVEERTGLQVRLHATIPKPMVSGNVQVGERSNGLIFCKGLPTFLSVLFTLASAFLYQRAPWPVPSARPS